MLEYCPYCGYEMHDNGQDCSHPIIMKNEFCCPNCDVHFDADLNEVPIDDLGIGRPQPTPPSQNPSQDSSQNPSQDSSTKPTTPAKPKIDSIYATPPSKNLSSQKVLKEIESLQDFLRQDFLKNAG